MWMCLPGVTSVRRWWHPTVAILTNSPPALSFSLDKYSSLWGTPRWVGEGWRDEWVEGMSEDVRGGMSGWWGWVWGGEDGSKVECKYLLPFSVYLNPLSVFINPHTLTWKVMWHCLLSGLASLGLWVITDVVYDIWITDNDHKIWWTKLSFLS